MARRRVIGRRLLAASAAVVFLSFAAAALAQRTSSHTIHVESSMVQPPVRVQSNLVLVPVYVAYQRRIQQMGESRGTYDVVENTALRRPGR